MRGLDGLGAGVHRQHHVLAAQLGERRRERAELVVVERAAGQREPVELRLRRRDERRVAGGRSSAPSTPARQSRYRLPSTSVTQAPSAARDDDGQRVVVVRGVLGLEPRSRRPVGRRVSIDQAIAIASSRSSSVQHLTPPPPSSSSDRSTRDRVVAALAQLRARSPVARGGDDDVAAVADRVEAEHRGVVVGRRGSRRGSARAAPPAAARRTRSGR